MYEISLKKKSYFDRLTGLGSVLNAEVNRRGAKVFL
jgi:hypothetical protein